MASDASQSPRKPAPLDYAPPRPPRAREDVAYILPMAAFLLFTWAGGQWPAAYPLTYVAKAILTAGLLVYFWPVYTHVRWNGWWLGVVVGVLGTFQWVGMQLWLQNQFEFFRPGENVFDPTRYFASPAQLYGFIAVRLMGAVLVVPVMEELFWRDFAWRTIIAPNDFKLAHVGEWDWKAFIVVPAIFSLVHGNWWLTAIVWAFMVGGLLVYTKSLGACIIAHATTNLLLGLYVLYSHYARGVDQWHFW